MADRLGNGHGGDADAALRLSGLLIGDESRASILDHVVHLAVAAIPRCDECGIAVPAGTDAFTTARTGDAAAFDAHQYAAHQGPCLDAFDNGHSYQLTLGGDDARWPQFAEAMTGSGMQAMVAIPLIVRERTIGTLGIYSRAPAPFTAEDRTGAELYAAQAGIALANVEAHEQAVELAAQLRSALDSRAVIDQAIGILMATRGLDAAQGFQELVAASQRENRKLRDIATTVVDAVVGG